MEQETKHPRIDNKKNTDGMKNIPSALHALIAEDTGLIPSWILRPCKLHWATKRWPKHERKEKD